MNDDYQPGAVPPSVDPLGDPAEAELQERLTEARALVDGIPIMAETARRFLERDAVEAMVLLQQHERSHFWTLKRKLAPFTILSDLNSEIARVGKELAEGEQKIAERVRLVALGAEILELWHDGSDAWCWPNEHGPGCCWRMPSSEAKRHLLAAYGERNQVTLGGGRKVPMTPGRQAVSEAIDQLEAQAYRGPRRGAPALRVGGDGARLVIDLCRDDYSVVVVENGGWQVVKPSPIAMRRAKGMQPLPLPVQGAGNALGDLRTMLGFDGAEHDAFWALVVGYMFAALRSKKPHFVGFISGHQGSGKSATAAVIRAPVDPHDDEAQPKPKSEDDLFVNCDGQWLVGYDNLSSLTQEMSDAFCRISTGSGYSKRRLYSDRDTVHFQVARPQLITAIVDIAAAPDLLDRGLLMQQPELGDDARIGEEEMAELIERAAPAVLGQLLDAAAVALRKHRTMKLPTLPRMAGPTKWVEAAAEVLGLAPLQFFDAYRASRARAGEMALEASVVGTHLESFLALRKAAPPPALPWFYGTARQLLAELDGFMSITGRPRGSGWPRTPQGMGRALHRIAPALEIAGYTVAFVRDPHTQKRDRWVTLAAPGVEVPSDVSDVSDVSSPASAKNEAHDSAQSYAPDPARPGNKRPKRPNGGPTCDQPDCQHQACATGPDGNWCADHMEAWRRRPSAGVPFMITNQMRADLRARGFSDAQIRKMTPEQAHAHLANGVDLRDLAQRAVKAKGATAVCAIYRRLGVHNFDTLAPQQVQEVRAALEALLS